MRFEKIRRGKYKAENGLTIQRMDSTWYIIGEQARVLHKCRTLADAKAIASQYRTKADIATAIMLKDTKATLTTDFRTKGAEPS